MAGNYFRSDGWVKLVSGAAVPGAQIYVLTQPANVVPPITPPRTTPVPFVPNPQAVIYSDEGLTQIAQPILTDGFGHYDFYTLPGLYTVAVYFNNTLQNYYVDQSIGSVGSSGGTSVLFSTNGSPNFNQSLFNLVQGAGIILNTDNFGNTTITNTGIAPAARTAAIYYVIDGGGVVVATGLYGQLSIPINCTITGWVLTADQAGSAQVDVLRSTYAAFPATASIAGTDLPTIVAAQKNENLAISAWGSTALSAGDQLQFNVVSAATVQRLNLTLNVTIP